MNAVQEAIDELRAIKSGEKIFAVTPDIDVVWVVSQPGTYLKPSNDGVYAGLWVDRDAIEYGIALAKQITALRTKKDEAIPENVTKEMVESNGPILFITEKKEPATNRTIIFRKTRICEQRLPQLISHCQKTK